MTDAFLWRNIQQKDTVGVECKQLKSVNMKPVKFFLTLFCSLLAFHASAQNTDGGATELLKKVSDKYQSYSSMQFRYTLKATKDDETLQTTTGDFAIKGSKYRTVFNGQRFFCDGTTIWNYQKATNEVSIYDYDPDDDDNMMNPQRILKNWNAHFRAKYIRDEYIGGQSVALIDLTPKTAQSYYRIRLHVDKSNSRIMRISVYDKDNTVYAYYIEQFKANVTLSDGYFVFDKSKYPAVEVNDMR